MKDFVVKFSLFFILFVLHNITDILTNIMISIRAAGVIPEEVPEPGEE